MTGCSTIQNDIVLGTGDVQLVTASWYGDKFHGSSTANGEKYDMHKMTAAHRTLPFGTLVLVTNVRNGRKAVVRINDRGPWKPGRLVDLSHAAASRLGMLNDGVARVRLHVIDEETGLATWYGKPFHGRQTASGERFDMYKLTAAHRMLPFGTQVRVTNVENGKVVTVRINDRMPESQKILINLSRRAAQELDMLKGGTARVLLDVVKPSNR